MNPVSTFDFCTYFDTNYMVRGLTLYRSLLDRSSPFRLWVLCMDEPTYEKLVRLELPEIVPLRLADMEKAYEGLEIAKSNRSPIEYYFTCTSILPLFILAREQSVDVITYLDADLYFFGSPDPIFEEMGDSSILIVGHRFPKKLKHLEKFGVYNVGFLSFRRDEDGMQSLEWWRDACLEWCHDYCDGDRFADQKYLDSFPSKFENVHVLENPGAGLAPWNIGRKKMRTVNGQLLADSSPVIFYHFQGLEKISPRLFDARRLGFRTRTNRGVRKLLYKPYINELGETSRWLAETIEADDVGISSIRDSMKKSGNQTVAERVKRIVGTFISRVRRVLNGDILWTKH